MAISESTLSRWSHHQAATAFTQAHLPIRAALDAYKWPSEIKYEVFLQGSYKNDTNLGGDSDVDVVVRLNQRLRPRVAELSGRLLQEDASHQDSHSDWYRKWGKTKRPKTNIGLGPVLGGQVTQLLGRWALIVDYGSLGDSFGQPRRCLL